jgi:hypothetical protein
MCLTGDIYNKKRAQDGSLKTRGIFSKVFSVLLVIVQLGAMVLFVAGAAVGVARARAQSFHCENNLKQMCLAFRLWALAHEDEYPFNVSTKTGGSKEHCARGSDGFDQNAALRFQVISNELSDPKILICPADTVKEPAVEFSRLQAVNVTYQVRSGTNISDRSPDEILAVCPVHNHVIRCDGTVQRGASGGPQP